MLQPFIFESKPFNKIQKMILYHNPPFLIFGLVHHYGLFYFFHFFPSWPSSRQLIPAQPRPRPNSTRLPPPSVPAPQPPDCSAARCRASLRRSVKTSRPMPHPLPVSVPVLPRFASLQRSKPFKVHHRPVASPDLSPHHPIL
jgi:hypothetical protein